MLSVKELSEMSIDELLELNSKIVRIIKLKRSISASTAAYNLGKGMNVEFIGKCNRLRRGSKGKIFKINRTRIVVDFETPCGLKRWSVAGDSVKAI